MNSTVLALLLLAGMNGLPERSGLPGEAARQPVAAEKSLQIVASRPTDQASRLAAKGRLPQDRLQLRLDRRLAVAQAGQ